MRAEFISETSNFTLRSTCHHFGQVVKFQGLCGIRGLDSVPVSMAIDYLQLETTEYLTDNTQDGFQIQACQL